MRRIISITMTVLFVLTMATGFLEARIHPGESGIHTPMAIAFAVVTITHMILNRKAMAKWAKVVNTTNTTNTTNVQ